MAVTNYFTVDGQIQGEETGGTFRGYVPDALGSVMATTTSGFSAENTYRYKPYGEQLAKTGAGADPKFTWKGSAGYRSSGDSSSYVRARHYDRTIANWLTSDPYPWAQMYGASLYNYVNANPVNRVDRSGMNWEGCVEPLLGNLKKAKENMQNLVKKICPDPENPPSEIEACWRKCGDNDPKRNAGCLCKHGRGVPGYAIKYMCQRGTDCDPIANQYARCEGKCMCTTAGTYNTDCMTWICDDRCSQSQLGHLGEALFHELLHCCNARHKYGPSGEDVYEEKGVPHPRGVFGGGLGANMLCLLNCLRPFFGLPETEPWVIPRTSSCSARGAIE